MEIGRTVRKIRSEYSDYLHRVHPDWSVGVLRSHVSGAFYLFQHDITLSFWQCFAGDEAMEAARQSLLRVLPTDQAEQCFRDTVQLRHFLDSRGGIQTCVGPEYDGEILVCRYAQQVYEKALSTEQALEALGQQLPGCSESMCRNWLRLFAALMVGSRYSRPAKPAIVVCMLTQIGRDYGADRLATALDTVRESIRERYTRTGLHSICLCQACAELAAAYRISLSFDSSIFDGILPQKAQAAEPVRCWLYAAGDGSANWDQDYADGIMAIGWSAMGALTAYPSKEAMAARMKVLYGGKSSYRNQALATWQFANQLKPGDVVFVKQGRRQIIGRGVVTGGYVYDPSRAHYRHTRTVRWTDRGRWEHPEQSVVKTLTDITADTAYVQRLQQLIEAPGRSLPDVPQSYTQANFLQDVYLDWERYQALRTLLLTKKNIILQGAPGVGKTYTARRLAYSILGEADSERVRMIQFHQSYSYEDFIFGYRPTETGFVLKSGVFYEFCRLAARDTRPYFFIIDEINRGNLSKIFGELFTLLEPGQRGQSVHLLYTDEPFSIPENVCLIGTMNTADRSLAMLDYALRRRFAFFDLTPAFRSDGFRAYQDSLENPSFNQLIAAVEQLNAAIAADDSLGSGFCIGHSYFCGGGEGTRLQAIVEYELIPLLREYWFDEPEKVRHWSGLLREAVR